MMKKSSKAGIFIVSSAIIWAAVILGCSYALSDTECYGKIQYILAGGVISHIFLIWGPLAIFFRKIK